MNYTNLEQTMELARKALYVNNDTEHRIKILQLIINIFGPQR